MTEATMSNYRELFAARLVKNMLLYSIIYLFIQSASSIVSPIAPPAFIWAGAFLSLLLIFEFVLVTYRKNPLAVSLISPSLLAVFVDVAVPIYSSFHAEQVEWNLRTVSITVGLAVYGCGLLLSVAFAAIPVVKRDLLRKKHS